MHRFCLIDQYLGTMMGIDVSTLKPEKPAVTETIRRLRCEQSYGVVHALYGIWGTHEGVCRGSRCIIEEHEGATEVSRTELRIRQNFKAQGDE